MVDISIRMKEAMDLRDMRATDLARSAGIGKDAVSRYLSGEYKPKQDAIIKMANALMVEPSWLMGFNVPMEKSADITKLYRSLDDVDKMKVEAYIEGLLSSDKYTKKERAV